MKNNLIKARTCTYSVNYHIVWTTKNNNKILNGEIKEFLKEELLNISKDKDFIINSIECNDYSIHLFVSAHPKIAPSYIVKMCKGITGRKISLKFPYIIPNLYKGTLWGNSFYLETIGSINSESINKYINK